MFSPEFYAGGMVGVNNFASEGYTLTSTPGKYTPVETLGTTLRGFAGYNITSTLGGRAGIGLSVYKWPNSGNVTQINTAYLSLDLMLNLSNLFSIYNLIRKSDISVYAGLAGTYRDAATFNRTRIMVVPRVGLQIDRRLNYSWDLNFSGELDAASDDFNELVNEFPLELMPQIMIGVAYHFRCLHMFRSADCNSCY